MNRIVAIGTSSGGLEALRMLLAALPADFPAAVCIVMHTAPQAPGVLPQILDRASALPVAHARDGERLQPGRVYIAPPDRHLLVEPTRVCLTKGPKENRFRPAIDPLFRSAAQVFGPAAIGVVLTGNLDDGTSGLDVIKRLGGVAIVQDPADALVPSMPQSAVDHVDVDHVVALECVAPLLVELTRARPAPEVSKAGRQPGGRRPRKKMPSDRWMSVPGRDEPQARLTHASEAAAVCDERMAFGDRSPDAVVRGGDVFERGAELDQLGLECVKRHVLPVRPNQPFHVS